MQSCKKQKQKGFSLIELLVVTALIVTLASVVWINSRTFGESLALERSANMMAQETRKAMEMSMSMEDYSSSCSGKISFGIEFEKNNNSYKRIVQVVESVGNSHLIRTACRSELETIVFEKNAKISLIKADGSEKNLVRVIFAPPQPKTFIFSTADASGILKSPHSETEIKIQSQNGDYEKTIKVNEAGLIEIN